ncbi:MAG: response regulator transcription factor [Chloroflexi bacterium]|nr:response regulator transcription factor [Chloroflexota bacterium]
MRLLLVDDHHLFREGVTALFRYQPDFEVVGQASNATEALQLCRELLPELVLMDIDMPGMNGLEALKVIKAEWPTVHVVMLTVYESDEKLFEAIKNGAQGYLNKNIRTEEMLQLLRGVGQGEAPITRRLAGRILKEFARVSQSPALTPSAIPAPPPETPTSASEETLTSREREVLELVAQHFTNKEIALRLNLSEYTVKNHLRNILAKLHQTSRRAAADHARRDGLL